jgi:uncharacterized protein with HEPN domain
MLVRASSLAREFAHGMAKSDFLTDVKTQSAVLHQLLILGEAGRRLTLGRNPVQQLSHKPLR